MVSSNHSLRCQSVIPVFPFIILQIAHCKVMQNNNFGSTWTNMIPKKVNDVEKTKTKPSNNACYRWNFLVCRHWYCMPEHFQVYSSLIAPALCFCTWLVPLSTAGFHPLPSPAAVSPHFFRSRSPHETDQCQYLLSWQLLAVGDMKINLHHLRKRLSGRLKTRGILKVTADY